MSEQSDRYTVTALIRFYEHETRHELLLRNLQALKERAT